MTATAPTTLPVDMDDDALAEYILAAANARTCKIDTCDRQLVARQLCGKHYQQWKAGKLDPETGIYTGRIIGRTTCEQPGCERAHRAHGLCEMHYDRWKAGTFDPETGADTTRRRATSNEDRWAYVQPTGFCWYWTGTITEDGYGQALRDATTGSGRGDVIPAHRWAYEQLVGPIPDGLVLDHLCRNRACVNPDHLEPVTARENTARGYSFIAPLLRGAAA